MNIFWQRHSTSSPTPDNMQKWTPEQWKTHLIGQKQLQDFQQGIAELKKSSEDTKKATLKLL